MQRLLVLLALSAVAATAQDIEAVFAAYYEDLLRYSPETATDVGRTDYDDRWSDLSPEGRAAWRELQRSYVERLEAVSPDGLSAQEQVSRDLLLSDLRQSLEGAEIESALLGLNQLFGYHTRVLLTLTQMPTGRVAAYENIIARLRATPAYVDGAVSALAEGVESGLTQPRYIAEIVAGQIEAQGAPAAAESPLLKAFREMPDDIAAAERARLLEQAEAAYREAFQPAWRKLHAFVAETYAPAGRAQTPVTTVPDGDAVYAHLVRRYTTTNQTPDQIHEIGLAEVERIEAAMSEIAKAEGYDSVDAYEEHLRTTPEQRYTTKEEMLADLRNMAKIVDPGLPALFKKLPRAPFGIRPIPEDREAASASNYSQPAVDGTRAGWFNLKAYQPTEQIRFDKPALVLHETNPGHHLQIATQIEIEGLPEFRKIYGSTAYIEGWALYAESFGEQLGVYDTSAARFGQLESERFRAKRLVVDTGLHAKGWSREKAIAYMGEEYTSEIDRYIAWPGQALGYKTGQLKILELRERARAALGEAFDIREFHDMILRNGPLPLELLEAQVDEWVSQQARP